MKEITVPEAITVTKVYLDNGEERTATSEITFGEFLEKLILSDPKFGKTMKCILGAVSIREKAQNTPVGEAFSVDDEYFEILKDVIEEPSGGYNPAIVQQLVPFLLAVTEAK